MLSYGARLSEVKKAAQIYYLEKKNFIYNC